MGNVMISIGGGGGSGSDDCTASKNQVLEGYTAITKDSDDEVISGTIPNRGAATYASKIEFIYNSLRLTFPKGAYLDVWDGYDGPVAYIGEQDLRDTIGYTNTGKVLEDTTIAGKAGTMPNKGAWNSRVGVNGKAVIPAGYHNGSGYVDQAINNRGAVNQSLAINGTYAIPEGYHNGAGKVTQSIAVQGGSTVTPGTANKTAVAAGRYVNGNVIVAGSANLAAQYIKKGVNIFGVIGTFEGYVPTATDLYYNGVNKNGFSISNLTLGALYLEQSTGTKSIDIYGGSAVNLTSYTKLNMLITTTIYHRPDYSEVSLYFGVEKTVTTSTPTYVAKTSIRSKASGSDPYTNLTVSVDITNLAGNYYIRVYNEVATYAGITSTKIYRIWLS